MKALIIGGAGFVGKHLIEYLCSLTDVDVYATKLYNENPFFDCLPNQNIYDLDILDKEQVKDVFETVNPDYIFHLAAQSSVSYSWIEPDMTFNVNVGGTINILEALRKSCKSSRVLLIGSAEAYGDVDEKLLPINENTFLNPLNPYAISKMAQEMMGKAYASAYGIDIVMVRPFNHFGPGQSCRFVASDFAKQIAEIEKGLKEPILQVGNINVVRDFTDVRDVVRLYWRVLTEGERGGVYNICSGKGISIKEMLDMLIKLSSCKNIRYRIDEKKFRVNELNKIYGDNSKIMSLLTGENEFTFIEIEKTLLDSLFYWRREV